MRYLTSCGWISYPPVLMSALYLVHTQYESRRLYVELEKVTAQSRKITTESERLQVEKRAEATPLKLSLIHI